jgi:hypothetical protein
MPASAPDNPTVAQIAEAIAAALPADRRAALAEQIALAAQVIAGLPGGGRGPAAVARALRAAKLAPLRAALAGKHVPIGNVVVSPSVPASSLALCGSARAPEATVPPSTRRCAAT